MYLFLLYWIFSAQSMLQSENYVTRRRSLKLLSEILLDRSNYVVMMRYISSKQNLKVGERTQHPN